jgi:putative transposase
VYLGIARTDEERHSSYRALFRPNLDDDAISDIRLALNQSQPLGSSRFAAMIEQAVGERREPRPRGRPRKPEEIEARRPK